MQHDPSSGRSASGGEKSPLSGFDFLKNITKKSTKADGQPPKRRGPKPDSKPALTRRQELNRQAQRTHRERKEMYIKALEQEVLRLKEIYSGTSKERDAVIDENRRLRELLAAHGVQYDFGAAPVKFQRENSGYGPSSSGSISGSYAPGSESTNTDFSPPPPLTTQHSSMEGVSQHGHGHGTQMQSMAQLPSSRLDYDQIGIDFVLTLERPCMDHMQYLLVRSHNPENQPHHHPLEPPDDSETEHMSGHALMATAPPHSHIMNTPETPYPCKVPGSGSDEVGGAMSTEGLAKLLDLSGRLPFDHYAEITPVMAWTMVLRHSRVRELGTEDFEVVKGELGGKVRCYGFGAVLEEFELRDALEAVFAKKDGGSPAAGSGSGSGVLGQHGPVKDALTGQQVAAY